VVFGEGMVNDAVSIILFKAISDMVSGGDVVFVWYTPLELLGRFLKNCILSVLMGISVGNRFISLKGYFRHCFLRNVSF
jgi:sodium/hydrogen exchanger-like protein 6/7/sodium/hydrogen exchanger 8